MEHKTLLQDIDNLVENELSNARSRFPAINSTHEGYAVILEEFEEMQEEIDKFQQNLQALWTSVKANNSSNQAESIELLTSLSKHIVKEGIQISAMCRRFDEDLLKK